MLFTHIKYLKKYILYILYLNVITIYVLHAIVMFKYVVADTGLQNYSIIQRQNYTTGLLRLMQSLGY